MSETNSQRKKRLAFEFNERRKMKQAKAKIQAQERQEYRDSPESRRRANMAKTLLLSSVAAFAVSDFNPVHEAEDFL